MADIEPDVITAIDNAVTTAFPEATVGGEYICQLESLPYVYVLETENEDYRQLMDQDGSKYSAVTYDIRIYSNKAYGKKSECKAIANVVNDVMHRLGFTRYMQLPIAYEEDASIYQLLLRFMGIVDENKTIYRRR